jgi:protease I
MQKSLTGRKVAILVGNGFDEMQMTDCQRALLGAGATLKIISPAPGLVHGWQGSSKGEGGWGHYHPVDHQTSETLAADFDMLLLPSGERSLAKLLETGHTLRIIRGFRDAGKPVAAIGSGISLLKEAGRLEGVTVAGGEDIIKIDGNILTATDTVEMKGFIEAMLTLFAGEESLKTAA